MKCHCLSSFLSKQKRSNLFVLSPSQDLLLDLLKVERYSSLAVLNRNSGAFSGSICES